MATNSLGQYELLHRLAHGGMAEIFLAKRRGPGGFDKRVVIKRVLPHLVENQDFVRMFLDEARLASRLSHPNIVQIFDFGVIDGTYFLCMEHLEGEDLATVLSVLRERGELISPHVAAIILSAACDAMHYAHTFIDEEGRPLKIVHRDLSPSNLFVTGQGAVKVLDFGVAKMEGKLVETQSGVVKGKFAYLSPEQAMGEEIDQRSDVFALGLILHEALTGKRVFKRANEAATLRAVLQEDIPVVGKVREDLPPELGKIVMKALARSTADRWQSAQEMRAALDEFLASRGSVPAAAQLQAFMKSIIGSARSLETAPTPAISQLGEVLPASTRANAPTVAGPTPELASTAVERTPSGFAPGRTPPPTPAPGKERPGSSLRALPILLGVTLVAIFIVGGWWITRGGALPEETGTEAAAAATAEEAEAADGGEAVAGEPDSALPEKAPTEDPAALAVAGQTSSGMNLGQAISRKGKRPRRRPRARATPPPENEPEKAPPKAPEPTPKPAPVEPAAPATGKLDVNCTPWCKIYVDGKDTGKHSPARGLELPVGKHRLLLINPDTQMRREKTVTIVAGKRALEVISF